MVCRLEEDAQNHEQVNLCLMTEVEPKTFNEANKRQE